jgi:dihydroorotate dehydrogenase electron transfer subunit
MKHQETAKILKTEKLAPDHFRLTLLSPKITKDAIPGQFIMIKCNDSTSPLLRRPIGINRMNKKKGTIDIVIRVVGIGTQCLSLLQVGEEIDILGPLGNGFDEFSIPQNVVLMGGGVGLAPLLSLAESLKGTKINIYALIGASSKSHILLKADFAKLGAKVIISTDDGTAGTKGNVTDLLKQLIKDGLPLATSHVFACGPKPMIKALKTITDDDRLPTQVLMEEWMACGVGACNGCTIKTLSGYKKVCSDGPVFDLGELA